MINGTLAPVERMGSLVNNQAADPAYTVSSAALVFLHLLPVTSLWWL